MNDNPFRWLIVPIGKEIVSHGLSPVAQKAAEGQVLSAGAILFVLPYLLFASYAGYLADRFSKRTVIVGCKVAEIAIMILGVAAILYGNLYVMYLLLFLMGTHSALFGPSKYGVIPEVVRADRIAAANGLVGMTTILAIVLGTVLGNYLYSWTVPRGLTHWWLSGLVLLGTAGLGTISSLFMCRTAVADPAKLFPVNPFRETYRDLATLISARPLLLAALGGAVFWSLGGFCQLNVDRFANHSLMVTQQDVGPLLAVLAVGVGLGNVLAGVLSRGRIELGLVPFGAAGIAAGSILLWTVPQAGTPLSGGYVLSCLWLFTLGFGGGMYDVPLESYLQVHSPEKSRGSILAAANFLTFAGTILASVLFVSLTGMLGLSGRAIFLVAGLEITPVIVISLWLVPVAWARLVFSTFAKIFYRVRIEGLEHLPREGGALLVANHVSWIDGLMLLCYSPRPIRMITFASFVDSSFVGFFARRVGTIPIEPEDRRSVCQAIRTARDAIRNGDLVCIFPEGGLTRSGHIQPFQAGFLAILKHARRPLVPIHLGGFWGSIFSFQGGRFFWKLPRRLPYPVSITFGAPMDDVRDVEQVRQAIEQLGAEAMQKQRQEEMIPPRLFLRMCRRNMFHRKVADTSGIDLTGAGLLTRTLVLRSVLRKRVFAAGEKYVGLMLPPSAGGVAANAAVTLDGRVAVNLNYTLTTELFNECIRQCGIRHVLTSRRVLERFPQLKIDAEVVCLEDLRPQISRVDKWLGGLTAWLVPLAILERRLGLTRIGPDELMSVIFTSGSTGRPKGVMLSYHNVGSNVASFNQVIDLRRSDVLLGVLPFFHSFGYTVPLWAALALEPKVVYHYSPLEAKQVGELCRQHGVTMLIVAPTFLRGYLRRCEREDFVALEVVIAGAEKLSAKLADEFESRFGVRPVEGYGTTELSPVVSTNVPPGRAPGQNRRTMKEGTVGRPIPGVFAKVVGTETGADLGLDQPGMLMVRGPNVMLGYLGQPELTAQVIRDGWYVTGDIGMIDAEGFIRITGRLSRFSKLCGEMVPHLRVEEAIGKILGLGEEEIRLVVTAVSDPKKGERLIVLHTRLEMPPEQICRKLTEELPPLWIPSPDSFIEVEAIPLLGTGKFDLQAVRELAQTRTQTG
jgi:acyl-[acyl-carrier-protein]-phospholipid O-acyltransferase/long-chain-fatty-acid--[acyl-carrier-protein] ligase